MPTYSYECKKCGHVEDVFHGISAKRRIKCEECGGSCRRLIGTGAGIIFKGSGFYETDYKTKSGKPSETESKSESSSEGDSSKKKDSKDTGGSSKASSKKAPAAKD